jgi:hypothetical protein
MVGEQSLTFGQYKGIANSAQASDDNILKLTAKALKPFQWVQKTLGKVPLVVIDKFELVRQQDNKMQRVRHFIFCGVPQVRDDGMDVVSKHSSPRPSESPNFFLRFSAHRPKFQRRIHKRS